MRRLGFEAPAKINLYLHVTGREPDGYHRLDSLVAFAGIGDTLDFRPADDLSLEVIGPTASDLPAGQDNLVLTAARLLTEWVGIRAGAAMVLTKRLPVAAGIGGGSADAAATLAGLIRLWRLDLPDEDLEAIALRLGADVPVCLAGHPTAMSGIGDILAPAPALPPAWLVLANPRTPLSTPAVFQARQGDFSAAAPLTAPVADARALAAELASRRNDLTPAAITLQPVIGQVLDALAAQPDCLLARMSGSGATCFGLFADEPSARAAAAALTARQPGWWIAAAPLMP